MSRFLKFIVHLVIILMILDVVALAVPPFFGITTTIIDGSEQGTNLATGSVTYARSEPVEDLQPGDMILVEQNDSVYKYKINSIDTSSNVFNVYDQTDVDAGEISIALGGTQPEVVVTVPYIGYLIVATQSREGMIIIALVIVLLVILFILSELWRKDKPEELQTGERQPGEEDLSDRQLRKKRKAEMKQREKEEALYDRQQEKEENQGSAREIKNKQKELRKEEKQRKKEEKKRARVGGFVEDYDPIETQSESPVISEEETATDEANQFLKKEVVAATQAASEEPPKDQLSATQDLSGKAAAPEQEETPNVTSETVSSSVGERSDKPASPETAETVTEKAPEAAETAETAKTTETAKAPEAAETTETAKASETAAETTETVKASETAAETTETAKAPETAETTETAKAPEAEEKSETEETSETKQPASSEEGAQTETAANGQSAQETPETETNTEQTQQPAPEEGPVVYQKMAIPICTEAELLEQARIAGEEPEVIRDEDLGITLLDYSRVIAEDTSGKGEETENQTSSDS